MLNHPRAWMSTAPSSFVVIWSEVAIERSPAAILTTLSLRTLFHGCVSVILIFYK